MKRVFISFLLVLITSAAWSMGSRNPGDKYYDPYYQNFKVQINSFQAFEKINFYTERGDIIQLPAGEWTYDGSGSTGHLDTPQAQMPMKELAGLTNWIVNPNTPHFALIFADGQRVVGPVNLNLDTASYKSFDSQWGYLPTTQANLKLVAKKIEEGIYRIELSNSSSQIVAKIKLSRVWSEADQRSYERAYAKEEIERRQRQGH